MPRPAAVVGAICNRDRRDGLELSVLFLSLRGDKPHGHDILDLRWAYLLLCVIAASMIPPETVWYYPSLVLLALWALFSRPLSGQSPGAGPALAADDRRRGLQRLGALALAALVGIGLITALRWGHDEVELLVMGWIDDRLGTNLDPYRASTAIGEVGTLKGSDRIRLRIYPQGTFDGVLLRTASYDRYMDGTWFTGGSPFEAADRPWTIAIGDLISWLRLSLPGAGDDDRASRNGLLLPLTALILILA